MIIAYGSLTGNVRRFVGKLDGFRSVHIKKDTVIDEPFVLITYTTDFGKVPKEVDAFLERNSENLVAVVGSGNKNWGTRYCQGAKTVSKEYAVPLLHEFEMSGLKSDVDTVTSKIREITEER